MIFSRTSKAEEEIEAVFAKMANARGPKPLKERLRRFTQPQEITDVWDFGTPGNPRDQFSLDDDYNIKVGWSSVTHYDKQIEARKYHEKWFGRTIVTREVVEVLSSVCTGKTMEVFAGRGWLTAHLRAAGVDIVALDNGSMKVPKLWTVIHDRDVVTGTADADVIIMQWPPAHVVAQRVVMRMKKGSLLLFYGDRGDWNNKLPTPGFWHHLTRGMQDRKLENRLRLAQPCWAGQNASWAAYWKR